MNWRTRIQKEQANEQAHKDMLNDCIEAHDCGVNPKTILGQIITNANKPKEQTERESKFKLAVLHMLRVWDREPPSFNDSMSILKERGLTESESLAVMQAVLKMVS